MFGWIRGRRAMALCACATMALVAAGCGEGDDESTAKEERVEVSAASEPAKSFIARTAKLLETTTAKKDCGQLDAINLRSVTRFPCPASKELRKSMASFSVVGSEEYGTGAVVDYKSGQVKDGAAIVLFVAPDANWGIGRFGILSEPSTETDDESNRDGYRKVLDEYLAAVRERDCDAFVDVTFNGDDKKAVVCKDVFPGTQDLAKRLKANPDAEPRYEGGNASYGFYSFETAKPDPQNLTISIAKATGKGPRPFVILDVTHSPTAAQRKQARKAFEEASKSSPGMRPSDNKPSEPAVK